MRNKYLTRYGFVKRPSGCNSGRRGRFCFPPATEISALNEPQHYPVKISQLPEELVEATSPLDASRKVGEIIRTRSALAVLHDDEPVVIKGPDRRVWLRNGTVGAFRSGAPVVGDTPEREL